MNARDQDTPEFPEHTEITYYDGGFGRMRSRAVGRKQPSVPEVVLVQGMGVSDYLLPGLAAFGEWTRAHLVELPGFAGSGDPPHELDVREFGSCVADWLRDRDLGRVILVGHSSGTQVAARAAVGHPDVVGVVLASPTVDPIARSLPRLLLRWRLDSRHEPSGLSESHRPEWKRAGIRRMLHIALVHRADKLEESVARLRVPLLVIRGREDRISTARWGRQLADLVPDGRYIEVPGAHTFPWPVPDAWSHPVRELAAAAGRV
ncbi:alpha/beta hydrolase [Streptomyces sp. HC44]|uniref:Alpha/beta hydrolase n=1 Tax=Streptomyces scabichelini TaxID=2711217 RepID=A0A6G4VFE6_9ACTN|nr:alpha/beta hydrolase [Streptomyces scabichelini]NGO12615.1 alpha/beta hydrolase [Streptomyces scabichelini]